MTTMTTPPRSRLMHRVTAAQREHLDLIGFFITDVVFEPSVIEGVRAEFERLWRKNIEAQAKGTDTMTLAFTRNRAFLSRLNWESPICDAFIRHPVFLDLCRQLIGPDADHSWNQAIIKPPPEKEFGDNAFGWHQDMQYALSGDYSKDCDMDMMCSAMCGFTAWVAVSRTTVDNSTLWVLPGAHRHGLLPHVYSNERREWQGQYDTAMKVPAVMEAGQMAVFRKWLPHASGPNVSNETRMAYQIGYTLPNLRRTPSPDNYPVLRDGEPVK